ncbi:hypothetical protein NL676_021078 [Syzygium grande]|nr:hypothetical protein NL676_021078 [Syzygium grande]
MMGPKGLVSNFGWIVSAVTWQDRPRERQRQQRRGEEKDTTLEWWRKEAVEVAAAGVKRKTLRRNGGEGVCELAVVRKRIGGTKIEEYKEGEEQRCGNVKSGEHKEEWSLREEWCEVVMRSGVAEEDRERKGFREGLEADHVDLVTKGTDVASDGVVLHLPNVVDRDDLFVAGGGDKDVGLGDNIVEESPIDLHPVQPLDNSGGRLGDFNESLFHLAIPLSIRPQPVPDYGQHDLELGIVYGRWVWEPPGFLIGLLCLDALLDEEGGIAPIVDDEARVTARAPVEVLHDAPPVLLGCLTLLGEDGSRVAGDNSCCMVLGGVDVTRAPTDLSTEGSEGLDEDGGRIVMWREPMILTPLRGYKGPRTERQDMRAAIWTSASLISRQPKSTYDIPLTLYSRPLVVLSI